MKEIYFDNNATTKVDEAVFEEMRPYFCELYGNPSSMHFFGGQVQKKVDQARNHVAALLGAAPEEIIFTACGTESDNAAIRSALEIVPREKTHHHHQGRASGGIDHVPQPVESAATGSPS